MPNSSWDEAFARLRDRDRVENVVFAGSDWALVTNANPFRDGDTVAAIYPYDEPMPLKVATVDVLGNVLQFAGELPRSISGCMIRRIQEPTNAAE